MGRDRDAAAGAIDVRLHEFVHVQQSAAVRVEPDRVSRDMAPPPFSPPLHDRLELLPVQIETGLVERIENLS